MFRNMDRWEGKKTMNISTFRKNETIVYEYIRSIYKLWCISIIGVMCKINVQMYQSHFQTVTVHKTSQYTTPPTHKITVYKYTFNMISPQGVWGLFPRLQTIQSFQGNSTTISRISWGRVTGPTVHLLYPRGSCRQRRRLAVISSSNAQNLSSGFRVDGYTPCKYKHSTWKVGDQKDEFPFAKAFLPGPC